MSAEIETAGPPLPDGVYTCPEIRLSRSNAVWPFEQACADAIAENWRAAQSANSRYFDGMVHVMTTGALGPGGILEGSLCPCRFKAYLYWRDHADLSPTTRDAFGSAIVMTADHAVMLGVQGAGQLNSGLAYPPGGMIDPRDVAADGGIDVVRSVARELAEETGIETARLEREDGFVVTALRPLLSIGVVYRSPLDATALMRQVARFLEQQGEPELDRVIVVRRAGEARALATPAFVQPLLAHLLPD